MRLEVESVEPVSRHLKERRSYRQVSLQGMQKMRAATLPGPAWATTGARCSASVRHQEAQVDLLSPLA